MEDLSETLNELIITYGLRFIGSIAIIILGRLLARVLGRILTRTLRKTGVEQTLLKFLSNVVFYGLFAIVILIALNNLGLPMTSAVAVLGAFALAIGLAMQDSLSNLAGGIIIILLRPYKLGDFVEVNGTEGYVIEVQIVHTILRTRDNRVVFVPNSNAIADNIVNYSKLDWLRLDLVFGIGYGDDLQKAKRILQEIVVSNPRVARDPAPTVTVMELGDNSVNFAVRPFVTVEDYVQVSREITEQVKLRFDQEGVSIPFPQRDVHLYKSN